MLLPMGAPGAKDSDTDFSTTVSRDGTMSSVTFGMGGCGIQPAKLLEYCWNR